MPSFRATVCAMLLAAVAAERLVMEVDTMIDAGTGAHERGSASTGARAQASATGRRAMDSNAVAGVEASAGEHGGALAGASAGAGGDIAAKGSTVAGVSARTGELGGESVGANASSGVLYTPSRFGEGYRPQGMSPRDPWEPDEDGDCMVEPNVYGVCCRLRGVTGYYNGCFVAPEFCREYGTGKLFAKYLMPATKSYKQFKKYRTHGYLASCSSLEGKRCVCASCDCSKPENWS